MELEPTFENLEECKTLLMKELKPILEKIGYELMGKYGADVTVSFGQRQPAKNHRMLRIQLDLDSKRLGEGLYDFNFVDNDEICYPGGLGS